MTTCHLCGHDLSAAPVVGTKARGGRDSRRVCCPHCHLVQVVPQPSAEELAAYYQGDYHREHGPVSMRVSKPDGTIEVHAPDSPGHADAVDTMHRYRARMVCEDLQLPKGARVLEIGCADGRTLTELQSRGMEVWGIEPDRDLARAADDAIGSRDSTEGVRCGTLDDVPRGHAFDAVVAFHVLEHLPDPLASLAKIRALLKPGGKVWFEVPNTYQPSHPLTDHWQWVHLYDFTAHTMAALMHRAGFDDVNIRDARGPLQAWATDIGSAPRAFEHHGGMDGATLAAELARIEAEDIAATPTETRTTLTRFLEGESVHDLAQARAATSVDEADTRTIEREIRRELAVWQAGMNRMAKAYRDATDMVGMLSEQFDDHAIALLESWHEDPWQHGFRIGEGTAMLRTRSLLAYLGNAMRLKEFNDAANGGRE